VFVVEVIFGSASFVLPSCLFGALGLELILF
jgi:hypothetical protein